MQENAHGIPRIGIRFNPGELALWDTIPMVSGDLDIIGMVSHSRTS
jgi:hypothetical protein